MTGHIPATLIAGSTDVFHSLTPPQREDLVSYSPDAVVITDEATNASVNEISRQHPSDVTLFNVAGSESSAPEHHRINGIDIISVPSYASLPCIKQSEDEGELTADTQTLVLSDLLTLDIATGELNTTLLGLEQYRDSLNPSDLDGEYIHLSTSLPPGYYHEWKGLTVRGIGADTETRNDWQFVVITVTQNAQVTTQPLSPNKLGLQALSSVGPTTAERLREAELTTRQAVANADFSILTHIKGIGKHTAEQVRQSANSITSGEPVRTSETPLPGSDPIFIDIETDGLSPTTTWLIGVKNSSSGHYMPFIERSPDPNGKAIKHFMQWFTANAPQRTLITWNGWNYDYPVLREHIQKFCPEYSNAWEAASKRDLLRWARDLDNCLLPGHTNKLEDVAEAMGWTCDDTGLSGAEVARQFRKWRQDPEAEPEPDWDRHKEYCRDDVESLEFIYAQIQDAGRLLSDDMSGTQSLNETTQQGSLTDF